MIDGVIPLLGGRKKFKFGYELKMENALRRNKVTTILPMYSLLNMHELVQEFCCLTP